MKHFETSHMAMHSPTSLQKKDVPAIKIPCNKCDFVAHSDVQMKKHMNVRHFANDKLLFVCDSVSSITNLKLLERVSQKSIKAVKANLIVNDDDSPEPEECFLDVVEHELQNDTYNNLVIAGGHTDVTSLNTKGKVDI